LRRGLAFAPRARGINTMHVALIAPFALVSEGFDPLAPSAGGGVLWTWVIFLVALPFIWKVVMGPIAKGLVERDEQSSRAVEAAKKAAADAERARAEVESRLDQAHADAAKELADARARAAAIVDGAKVEAQKARETELEAARRAIQAEQDKAIAAIRDQVVDLSISGARAVLQRNVGTDDDRRMVADLVGGTKGVKK
jgi:F-type H+-transporting ATPase subunit b